MKIQQYVSKSLLFALGSGYERIWRDFNALLRNEDCNFLQSVILISMMLEESPDKVIRPSDLANALNMSKSNVSHCVSALEKRGLLKRTFDPKDARSYRLLLRPEGRKLAVKLMKVIDRVESFFEDRFGERDVTKTIDALGAYEKAYRELRSTVRH